MSTILNLGVFDLPYSHEGNISSATTGKVAQWLEDEYGIMQVFCDMYHKDIINGITNSIQGSLESILSGHADINTHDPFGSATSMIDAKFKNFIATEEMANVTRITTDIFGFLPTNAVNRPVPTRAALMGKSSRFKIGKNFKWKRSGKKPKTSKFTKLTTDMFGFLPDDMPKERNSIIGQRRPSFIDTGLYQSSFKSWVEVK